MMTNLPFKYNGVSLIHILLYIRIIELFAVCLKTKCNIFMGNDSLIRIFNYLGSQFENGGVQISVVSL